MSSLQSYRLSTTLVTHLARCPGCICLLRAHTATMSQALPIDIHEDGELGSYLRGLKARDHEEDELEDDYVAGAGAATHAPVPASRFAQAVVAKLQEVKFQVQTESERDLDGIDIPVPHNPKQWRQFVFENQPPPLAWFVLVVDRPTIFKLLNYFTKWLCSSSDDNLSLWIWTVFVRIDREMDANEVAVIRDLGKKARKLVEKVEADNPVKYTLEMVVAVVAYYYGQKDIV